MRHQFTEEQVRGVVHALDAAGVEVIEVTHGDGLGGSSFNYGFSLVDEIQLIRAAVDEAERAQIAVLLLPGVGTVRNLREAHDAGATVARIATHCTEADVAAQHFGAARELGMEAVGFLMLAHRIGPAELAAQARIMVDSGAQCVYVVDSAGALVLADAQSRVLALIKEIGAEAEVGFHGHQNLSLGIANSVLAAQAGATQVDGALCALGAGAGNAPTEVLAATFDRLGIRTGVDVPGAMAAAEEVVRPFLPRLPWVDRNALIQGYAGVYGSFLLHAEQAAERYGVPAHEILQRVGEAGYVGGQEDLIIEIALQLQQEAELGATERAPMTTAAAARRAADRGAARRPGHPAGPVAHRRRRPRAGLAHRVDAAAVRPAGARAADQPAGGAAPGRRARRPAHRSRGQPGRRAGRGGIGARRRRVAAWDAAGRAADGLPAGDGGPDLVADGAAAGWFLASPAGRRPGSTWRWRPAWSRWPGRSSTPAPAPPPPGTRPRR